MPTKPTAAPAMIGPGPGSAAPSHKASTRFVVPATSPLIIATCTGSAAESLRVRLLSMPQQRHAAGDQQPAEIEAERLAVPGQHHRPGQNRRRADQQTPIDILAKHQPGDGHGGEALEIEQQRSGGGTGLRKAEHKQQRAEHAAEDDDGGQPRHVAALQPRLDALQSDMAPPAMDDREPDAGPEIEDAGEQPRIDRAEQQLRQRRGSTEQDCRAKRQRHAGPEVGVILDHGPSVAQAENRRQAPLPLFRPAGACLVADMGFDLVFEGAFEIVLVAFDMGDDFADAPEFEGAEAVEMRADIDVGRVGRHHVRGQRMHHDLRRAEPDIEAL